jgi:hypothetical protein
MSPRRITGPVEAMAHRVAERVVDLVLDVVDLFLAREAELARIPPGG